MIEELKGIFSKFAEEHNLRWNFEYCEATGLWVLTYQNQEQSWGYRRVFTVEDIKSHRKMAAEYGEHVLDRVLAKMRAHNLV